MIRKVLTVIGLILIAVVLLPAVLPPLTRAAGDIQDVLVTNWPRLWQIQGDVTISKPIPQTQLVELPEQQVTPVSTKETTRLIYGGTLDTKGFPSVVFSLAGLTKADVFKAGEVGAILIPEVATVIDAFNEKGVFLFPLEVRAQVGTFPPYFSSGQPKYTIGFDRYRIYYFNTTDKTATVHLYAYLTQ